MNGAVRERSGARSQNRTVRSRESAMRKHIRKWMFAGLAVLAAAPALAGCVAEVGPGYYHGYYHGYHHGYWHDDGRRWR
jgi:hypothetical protein